MEGQSVNEKDIAVLVGIGTAVIRNTTVSAFYESAFVRKKQRKIRPGFKWIPRAELTLRRHETPLVWTPP